MYCICMCDKQNSNTCIIKIHWKLLKEADQCTCNFDIKPKSQKQH